MLNVIIGMTNCLYYYLNMLFNPLWAHCRHRIHHLWKVSFSVGTSFSDNWIWFTLKVALCDTRINYAH